jgi:hypothetical protein
MGERKLQNLCIIGMDAGCAGESTGPRRKGNHETRRGLDKKTRHAQRRVVRLLASFYIPFDGGVPTAVSTL